MDSSPLSVEITVALGGPRRLLNAVFAEVLADWGLEIPGGETFEDPAKLSRNTKALLATRPVVLLLDAVGDDWTNSAIELRETNSTLGLVVVAARPSYAETRRWQRRIRGGRNLANSVLSLESLGEDLLNALRHAYETPERRSEYFLDGPRHPAAFHGSPEGQEAANVVKDEKLHETLALEAAGKSRAEAARRLKIKSEQVGERLSRLRSQLAVRNDVALGSKATRLGLLDDIDELIDEG